MKKRQRCHNTLIVSQSITIESGGDDRVPDVGYADHFVAMFTTSFDGDREIYNGLLAYGLAHDSTTQ